MSIQKRKYNNEINLTYKTDCETKVYQIKITCNTGELRSGSYIPSDFPVVTNSITGYSLFVEICCLIHVHLSSML